MSTKTITVIALGVFAIVSILIIGGCSASLYNKEVSLRALIENKQTDNKQQLANMRNKFKETAQVTDKEADLLTEAFVKYANARTGQGGGSLVTLVTEAVPNINPQTLKNLQNILASGRDAWTQRQTELLDLSREHKQLIRRFPNNIVFSIFGVKNIDIIIVTSSDAENAFKTGQEESIDLFGKKK